MWSCCSTGGGEDGGASLKTYLFTIGKRKALSHLHRRGRRKEQPLSPLLQAEALSLEDRVCRDEERRELVEAIRRLPEQYQEALYLLYFEGLTLDEAARVLGKNKKQVENLSYRGKQALKQGPGKGGAQMKTPEEFKAAVYQKRDAAQKRRKRTALGLCLAAVVVLGGGFFALRGLGLSGVTGYEEGGPTLQVLAPPALQDLHDMDALYSTTEDGAFTIDQEAREEFNRLGREAKVEEAFPQAVSGFAQKAAPPAPGRGGERLLLPPEFVLRPGPGGVGLPGGRPRRSSWSSSAPPIWEWLGDQAGRCYRQLYQDNDRGTLTMANSLWLQKGYPFAQSFLDTAGENYFASLFSGDFRDPQLGSEVSRWISDNTQGLLAPELQFDTSARLAVVNALYFHSKWTDEFDPQLTSPEEFTRARRLHRYRGLHARRGPAEQRMDRGKLHPGGQGAFQPGGRLLRPAGGGHHPPGAAGGPGLLGGAGASHDWRRLRPGKLVGAEIYGGQPV